MLDDCRDLMNLAVELHHSTSRSRNYRVSTLVASSSRTVSAVSFSKPDSRFSCASWMRIS